MGCTRIVTKKGVDYLERFTTVVKTVSYKYFFAIGVKQGLKIRHMDVVTAFIYGFLDKDIYVIQP